jgi:hypothetical protein
MLEPGVIKDVKVVALQYRLAAFPVELEAVAGFKDLYLLLQDLNTPVDGLTYAQAETQKEKHRHLLKILWAFGLFGEFDPDGKALTLDHKIYLAQKIHSSYDRVQDYFETLDGYGVHCEIVLLVESRWLTPTGALRRQGVRENSPPWEMKMTVDESIGGVPVINALQRYASDLDAAFGKTAYRKFARADMQVGTD